MFRVIDDGKSFEELMAQAGPSSWLRAWHSFPGYPDRWLAARQLYLYFAAAQDSTQMLIWGGNAIRTSVAPDAKSRALVAHELGQYYLRHGKWEPARYWFNEAVCHLGTAEAPRAHPVAWADALWHMGQCLVQLGRLEEALNCFDLAWQQLEARADDQEARQVQIELLRYLALFYQSQDMSDQAAEVAERAVAYASMYGDVSQLLAAQQLYGQLATNDQSRRRGLRAVRN